MNNLFSPLLILLIVLYGCNNQPKESKTIDFAHSFLLDLIEIEELNQNKGISLTAEILDSTFLANALDKEIPADKTKADTIPVKLPKIKMDTKENHGLNTIAIFTEPLELSLESFTLSSRKKTSLTTDQIRQLINFKSPTSYTFDNSILKFNSNNQEYWYKFSYPVFTADSNHVFIKISALCKGLCGAGETAIYS